MTSEVYSPPIVPEQEAPEEYVDTYAWGGTERFEFNNGKQWFEFKKLSEGDRVRYERMTNKDLTFNRQSGDARIKVDMGGDRAALIRIAVVNWRLMTKDHDQWVQLPFTDTELNNWLNIANPKIVEDLDQAIRKANPWLGEGDETVEDIDKAIADLVDRRREVEQREAGKGK